MLRVSFERVEILSKLRNIFANAMKSLLLLILARRTSYIQTAKLLDLYNSRKIMEKSAFLHEMHNIGPILAQHWYNIIRRNRVWKVY